VRGVAENLAAQAFWCWQKRQQVGGAGGIWRCNNGGNKTAWRKAAEKYAHLHHRVAPAAHAGISNWAWTRAGGHTRRGVVAKRRAWRLTWANEAAAADETPLCRIGTSQEIMVAAARHQVGWLLSQRISKNRASYTADGVN